MQCARLQQLTEWRVGTAGHAALTMLLERCEQLTSVDAQCDSVDHELIQLLEDAGCRESRDRGRWRLCSILVRCWQSVRCASSSCG